MSTVNPFPNQILNGALPAMNIAGPSYNQAVIAVAAFGRHVVQRAGLLEAVVFNIGTTGTVTDTVFRVQRIPAGSSTPANIDAAATTVLQSAADGVIGVVAIGLEVSVGDVIQIDVTTAPTAGANFSYSPVISQLFA